MATVRRLHLRLDETTAQRLDTLQQKLGIDATNVIKMALKRLAEQECPHD